jgi:hypothetical protein
MQLEASVCNLRHLALHSTLGQARSSWRTISGCPSAQHAFNSGHLCISSRDRIATRLHCLATAKCQHSIGAMRRLHG